MPAVMCVVGALVLSVGTACGDAVVIKPGETRALSYRYDGRDGLATVKRQVAIELSTAAKADGTTEVTIKNTGSEEVLLNTEDLFLLSKSGEILGTMKGTGLFGGKRLLDSFFEDTFSVSPGNTGRFTLNRALIQALNAGVTRIELRKRVGEDIKGIWAVDL